MDEQIFITEGDLRAAYVEWETAHRNGECLTHEETSAMSIEDVAADCARGLWDALKARQN